jgi:cell division protein FtsI/penicillin-binding protein 2
VGVSWSHAWCTPSCARAGVRQREVEEVDRAPILAADGTVLAGEGDRVTFGFEPTAVEDPDAVVEAFEEAIPGSGAGRTPAGRTDLVDGWFYPVVTVSAARAEEVGAELREVSGVLRRTGEGRTLLRRRLRPARRRGRVDEATAEQLEELGEPYEPGDEVGQFGLEQVFETDLIGSEQVRVGLRDGDGPVRHLLAEHRPTRPPGRDHPRRRRPARDRERAGRRRAARRDRRRRRRDGAIRGSASRPLFGLNRAFAGRYPPGSTFKLVTAEALLAAGATTPTTRSTARRDGRRRAARSPTPATATSARRPCGEAFADSCNTTFARSAPSSVPTP